MTTGSSPHERGVSYVMPVLNDAKNIIYALESLLAQEHDEPFEIIIALAPSTDGTEELLHSVSKKDARILLLENPIGSTPVGLNIAIQKSQYPVVIRVDAHSLLPSNYTQIALKTLRETGADNVGGLMDAQGITSFEQAVAEAYGSRVGLGGTKLHVGGTAGEVDTVYLGVFQRKRLFEVNLFDEHIKRGQDWELNRRLRKTGGKIWFTPELRVVYRPRSRLDLLARQFFSTGVWRGELTRRFQNSTSFRYFAPPIFVMGMFLSVILAFISRSFFPDSLGMFLFAMLLPAIYTLFLVWAACFLGMKKNWRIFFWLFAVLPCIHFCWGVGFILGHFSLIKNITNHTGR